MSEFITEVDALESCVGKLPGPRDLKVIDFLDDNAIRWMAASPFLFATFGDATHIAITAAGGERGFVKVKNPTQFSLPLSSLDDATHALIGQGFGSLFLVPGIDETLRANGRIAAITQEHIVIAVHECYLHCAKALIRSAFWSTQKTTTSPNEPNAYLNASRFMALATMDREQRADLSPKGDPAGALFKHFDNAMYFPDRPGNRRIDSFRNILSQPHVAAMALIPGANTVVIVEGHAQLSIDTATRSAFTVNDKTPKLVTKIKPIQQRLYASPALLRAQLWPVVPTTADLDPAEIFKAHVKLNRIGGVAATIARTAVSIPGMMRKTLDNDYKNNLY